MAPGQYGDEGAWEQGSRGRRPRRRRCLLKGCEQWFQPRWPQERYCGEECRQAARRWRRWRASRCYRASERGKECRRCQSRRYRERCRERRAEAQLASRGPEGASEGQRAGEKSEAFPCSRPGCYELIHPSARSPLQKCCSCGCCRALRRVRQREWRWRRRGARPHSRRGRGPPGRIG